MKWPDGGTVLRPAARLDPAAWSWPTLSGRIAESRFIVVEDFELAEAKTKGLLEILKRFDVENALIVDAKDNQTLKLSARNLQKFKYLATSGVNVMDVLRYDNIIMTKSSVEEIEGALKR